MAGQRRGGSAEGGAPVPRDMPDQQADAGHDRWEATPRNPADDTDDGADVPDTDEAGTGRGDTPFSAAVHPDHPVPEEPSD